MLNVQQLGNKLTLGTLGVCDYTVNMIFTRGLYKTYTIVMIITIAAGGIRSGY